jgi:hypothetical protein
VSEEHVRDVCRQILEDAKQMYCSNSQSRGSSPFNEHSDSETGSIGEYRFGRPNTRVSAHIITFYFPGLSVCIKEGLGSVGFQVTTATTSHRALVDALYERKLCTRPRNK